MRWPWQKKTEARAGGGYTDAIVAAIEAQASAQVADVSGTAAIEAAAGALSRAFSSADVAGPSWVQETVNPVWLAQVGRSLIRDGASLSVIVMPGGVPELVPAAFWNFENQDPGAPEGEREDSWRARVTTYGPSTTHTRTVGRERMIFVRWGTSPGTRYRGQGPTSWASLTARLQGETERTLGDESAGPLAKLLTTPEGTDTDSDDDTDPWSAVRTGITNAKGKALLLETTRAGAGEGPSGAPRRDWESTRLGAEPPAGLVELSDQAFSRMLAACGCSAAMFDDSDGTAKREALRQWHLGTVRPLAGMLEYELTRRLAAPVKLKFDNYPVDLAGRAQSFRQLVSQGVEIERALAITGLLMPGD